MALVQLVSTVGDERRTAKGLQVQYTRQLDFMLNILLYRKYRQIVKLGKIRRLVNYFTGISGFLIYFEP